MAHVFRLQTEGKNTIEGWKKSQKYSTQLIEQIKDPNGESDKKQITSIPSPFARIDLVKTAFKTVSAKDNAGNYNNIEGNTIFHKMVSDSLDVAQIFFEYTKFSDKVDIIPWDAETDLKNLLNSNNSAHKQLGETYDLFMKQDASSYNFDKLKRIYLLNYKNGPDELNIIGATSPATLFFSSANDLKYVGKDIVFGQDKPFDDGYMPLYKRDIEFHKYLWWLMQYTQDFASLFPEVYAYLQGCFTCSDQNRRSQLQNVTKDDNSNYDSIAVMGNAGFTVEVLGIDLKKARPNVVNISNNSDFVIDSQLFNGEKPPLVLPIDTFTQNYTYVRDSWDRNTKVPFQDPVLWQNRTLPGDGTPYPYLTISDFLEDYIIRTPYGMTDACRRNYFDGNVESYADCSFLLPVKDLFFEFFTVEQLMGTISRFRMFEIRRNAGGVTVILRVPIRNNRFIEYQRNYFDSNDPNIASNKGAIVEFDFAFAMGPNIKFSDGNGSFYRFALIHNFSDTVRYDIECKLNAKKVDTKQHIRNTDDSRYPKGHVVALEKSNFDYVRLQCNNASGIIVPKLKNEAGTDVYTFSVDFGTTNTHIEYKVNEDAVKEFDITDTDTQIVPFADYASEHQVVFDSEFIPALIGPSNHYNFPMRTAMTEAKNTDWTGEVLPMAHAGFAFTYEKLLEYQYNRIITNLKWSNENNNIRKVRCYIESLMILLRNKVVLNNGNLQSTKIVWFYPISMSRARFNSFKSEWESAFEKYFGDRTNICAMTESLAPYEFYRRSHTAVNNIVTIDVGGGTTDVVMVEGDTKYITSFRFAANSIFGDAYADNNGTQNGIVRQFKDQLKEILRSNGESQLLNVFDILNQNNNSADIASFLFSLKDNVANSGISSNVDFNEILQHDSTQKMSFVFFYAAIVYHIAQIMKGKGFSMPRHIAFSGNGSKVVSILSPDLHTIEKFTKKIFEEVYGNTYPSDGLTIIYSNNQPKEATCKGGIICTRTQDYDDVRESKVVLGCSGFVSSDFKYNDINEAYIAKTVASVKDFVDFVFKLDKNFSFRDHFDVDPKSMGCARNVCYRDLTTYTEKGKSCRMEEVDGDASVEETLFFYPLNGMLNALADSICNINNQ